MLFRSKPGRPLRPTLDAGRPGAPRPHVDVHEVGPRVVAERLEPGADRRLVEGARIVVRHRHVERLADQMPGPWLATLRPVVRRAAVAAGDDERRPERVAKPQIGRASCRERVWQYV